MYGPEGRTIKFNAQWCKALQSQIRCTQIWKYHVIFLRYIHNYIDSHWNDDHVYHISPLILPLLFKNEISITAEMFIVLHHGAEKMKLCLFCNNLSKWTLLSVTSHWCSINTENIKEKHMETIHGCSWHHWLPMIMVPLSTEHSTLNNLDMPRTL